MNDYLQLTGLDSEAVLRPFLEDFFPGCSSLATFSFPISDFFSADTYMNKILTRLENIYMKQNNK